MQHKRMALITALICMTTIVSHSIGRSVYGLLLPAIKEDFGLSNSQAGMPSSGIYVLYIVGVLSVVVLSPRLEPITIMRGALVASTLGLAITATSSGLAMLTVGVSLVGGAGAGIWMTAPVLATQYVSEKRRGAVIGALTSTIGLANIAFGFGTSALRRSAGDDGLWRPVWWVAFGFTAAILVALVLIARFPVTDRIAARGIDLSILKRIPRWKQVTLAYALFGGTSAGFSSFIVEALEEHGGVTSATGALVFSMMGVTGMVAAPLAGALSDQIGRMAVMRITLVVLCGACLLVAAGGSVAAIAGALVYATGASSFPALIAIYVRDSLDNRSFSQALAIMTLLFSVVSAILPSLVGNVADLTNSFAWPYAIVATLPAIALIVLGRDPRSVHSVKAPGGSTLGSTS